MTAPKRLPPRPVEHHCPACQLPQTKIQRKLNGELRGPTNYVCTRAECVIGINLTKVDTWVEV